MHNDSTLITDRIRTFDDALTELHKRTDNGDLDAKFLLDDGYNISLSKHTSDLNAFAKLRIITYALNEGWKATYSSFSSGADEPERYYPYFNIEQNTDTLKYYLKFVSVGSVGPSVYTGDGAKLCFKSRELAEYAGMQFTELYTDLTINNRIDRI